jgi:hypothetical protein
MGMRGVRRGPDLSILPRVPLAAEIRLRRLTSAGVSEPWRILRGKDCPSRAWTSSRLRNDGARPRR